MKTIPRILAAALLLALSSFAQSPTLLNKQVLNGRVHFAPQAMPTALTSVTKNNALIYMIVVSATGAQTVLIQDGQGTPIPVFPSFTTATGTLYVAYFADGYYCPGGISVQAGGAGVNYYLSFGQ